MNIGDIVKRKSSLYEYYYENMDKNDTFEVTETKAGSNCPLIRLKRVGGFKYWNSNVWYKSNNFKVVEESSNKLDKNEIFLVFSMTPTDTDNGYSINLQAGAVQFNSEKEAKDAVRSRLEESPDSVFGIFPLAYLVSVEKPPVKFTQVWKK